MLTPLHDQRRYVCPGETGELERSVHLARLASSYPACRSCPHHGDTGALLPPQVEFTARHASPTADSRDLLRTGHGFRGIAVNQLDRQDAIRWAAGLASLLWDDLDSTDRSVPTVVLGYDERPAAPEVMVGFARGLERMSCRVIDLGLTTLPCLRFAVNQLDADAGAFLTGSGCDPAWIGFDVVRNFGLPADPEFLDRWQTVQRRPVARPSRTAGSVSPCSVIDAYEASLQRRFHAVRPLQVVVGTPSPQLRLRLERLFSRLPGRLHAVMLPTRRRDLADPADADLQRVGVAVRERAAHLGVVIDDDAAAAAFLDERGELVAAQPLQVAMISRLLREHAGGTVVVGTDVWDELAPEVTSRGGTPLLSAHADLAAKLMFAGGILAIGNDHRCWFGETPPVCDAIVTLSVVLQLLSQSDADCSRVLAGM